MFAKILIANRGEIACRVMRTARRMGIATVAVFSEADAGAAHVREADEAVPIGPSPAAQSYLDIGRIVTAALESGAEAVHPGYGFLSENPAFVVALERAGLVFIGPTADAIAAMGDKIEAKRIAVAAGVTTIPGSGGALADADEAAAAATAIGYPVMIKAAAGGGGRGMRIAAEEGDTREAFTRAASEAKSAFGDGRVFVEKYIADPRHIEIQVLADGHGNVIHLGERECSIQRRHQKVIEECPSPHLDEATRQAMGGQALALARAVAYRSAGTVEFIVDAGRRFYFLEMNTRLQVEHPVTELVTRFDIVEAMIRIAAGEPLGISQDSVRAVGWALEARVYAEDPAHGFVPSSGRLRRYAPPPPREGVRIDAGVAEGDDISVYYDPLIAKVCTHGRDRAQAIERMRTALDRFYIRGIHHNVGFLNAVMGHPRFAEARLSTGFIAEEFDDFDAGAVPPETARTLVAIAAVGHQREFLRGRAGVGQAPREWAATAGGATHAVSIAADGEDWRVVVDGSPAAIAFDWNFASGVVEASVDGRAIAVLMVRLDEGYRLSHGGAELAVIVRRPRVAELAALMPAEVVQDTAKTVRSPMPGLVLSVAVAAGEEVEVGQALAIVEAMKMENVVRAERDGTIAAVHASAGEVIAADAIIVEFA